MSPRAQEFAATVLAAFRAQGLYDNESIPAAGGPSTTTVSKMRAAAEGKSTIKRPRSDTMRKINTAAKWIDGTAEILWETGELPSAEDVRGVGSGGVPVPEVQVIESSAWVEMGSDDVVVYRARARGVDHAGVESECEVTFRPAAGIEVHLADMGSVAGEAYRGAIAASYQAGTRRRLSVAPDTTAPLAALEAIEGVDQKPGAPEAE